MSYLRKRGILGGRIRHGGSAEELLEACAGKGRGYFFEEAEESLAAAGVGKGLPIA